MSGGVSFLAWWFGFLYLDVPVFLKVGEVISYYFIEKVVYGFSLYLFPFVYTYDSKVWSFDDLPDVLCIPLIFC
jgi:hypothetical protein